MMAASNIHFHWVIYRNLLITTVPSELGYGDRGAGARIPGGSVLVFTLELLKVTGDYVKADM